MTENIIKLNLKSCAEPRSVSSEIRSNGGATELKGTTWEVEYTLELVGAELEPYTRDREELLTEPPIPGTPRETAVEF